MDIFSEETYGCGSTGGNLTFLSMHFSPSNGEHVDPPPSQDCLKSEPATAAPTQAGELKLCWARQEKKRRKIK